MESANQNSLIIYQKSLALKDLSTAIARYFSSETGFFEQEKKTALRHDIAYALFTDAELIASTVRRVSMSSSKTFQSKHLTFVNIMTRNILAYCKGLEEDGVKEKEYLNLLRREIKTFRSYFKQWRRSLISYDD
ncbi:hypothetical protein [uncultured Croceitalea sp.]|uniref:hypothetical protein n=1 Tax=uncultured Croceitalea sp. TaxID=1798908 RepID=UPI0033061811